MAASIYDVAKRAGVSISTVSRILNSSATVSEKKRAAVMEAMEYFNYEPNQFARGLVKQQSNMIGVYISGTGLTGNPSSGVHSMFDSSYNLELLKGIEKVLAYQNYSMALICEDEIYNNQINVKPKYLEYVKQKRIDGLILSGLNDKTMKDEIFRQIMEEDFPLVYIGKRFHQKGLNVYARFEQYALQMITELYQNGHRKILYYTLHAHYLNALLEQARESLPEVTIYPILSNEIEIPREQLVADLKRYVLGEGCSAVCIPGMEMAQALLSSCAQLKLEVPDQVSLLAVEHKYGDGESFFPPVSAFYVPARDMGSGAADLLLTQIRQGQVEEPSIEYETRYVKRASIRRI